mmetsp:Transcript_7879/g.19510  ORF Transcript_7879/g.19510 Transcript_7879/m.19510 type:complete len:175 (+) Transcript_7879:151-675(+)
MRVVFGVLAAEALHSVPRRSRLTRRGCAFGRSLPMRGRSEEGHAGPPRRNLMQRLLGELHSAMRSGSAGTCGACGMRSTCSKSEDGKKSVRADARLVRCIARRDSREGGGGRRQAIEGELRGKGVWQSSAIEYLRAWYLHGHCSIAVPRMLPHAQPRRLQGARKELRGLQSGRR